MLGVGVAAPAAAQTAAPTPVPDELDRRQQGLVGRGPEQALGTLLRVNSDAEGENLTSHALAGGVQIAPRWFERAKDRLGMVSGGSNRHAVIPGLRVAMMF